MFATVWKSQLLPEDLSSLLERDNARFHLFPKEAEIAMLSAKELRERKRFRSFTTFSVFVRLKAKGKGILMRPVLYSSPTLGDRRRDVHRKLCTGHGFISNASDTRALFSTCTRRIHQNVRASCTYARTSLISSLHGGQVGVTRTALAGFLEDKGVTSLPEIEVCYHSIILSLKLRIFWY